MLPHLTQLNVHTDTDTDTDTKSDIKRDADHTDTEMTPVTQRVEDRLRFVSHDLTEQKHAPSPPPTPPTPSPSNLPPTPTNRATTPLLPSSVTTPVLPPEMPPPIRTQYVITGFDRVTSDEMKEVTTTTPSTSTSTSRSTSTLTSIALESLHHLIMHQNHLQPHTKQPINRFITLQQRVSGCKWIRIREPRVTRIRAGSMPNIGYTQEEKIQDVILHQSNVARRWSTLALGWCASHTGRSSAHTFSSSSHAYAAPIQQSMSTSSSSSSSSTPPPLYHTPIRPIPIPSTTSHLSQHLIPHWQRAVNHYDSRVFCAQFSRDGERFMIASQDHHVRLYETSSDWNCYKDVACRGVGWSIVDLDFSPDSRFLGYSTWSHFVQLANVDGDYELHEALDFQPIARRFCLFSIKFSPDGRELLGGASDNCAYLYDIERKQKLATVSAHSEDVNSVCFADASAQIFCTASDDTLIRVWDRRMLSARSTSTTSDPSSFPSLHKPVGVFIGHREGITHIDSREDGRYFCTNGKDQCIKLWDIRKLAEDTGDVGRKRSHWDYRWETYAAAYARAAIRPGSAAFDCSVHTFRGHSVLQTLIRCYFSPSYSTGQRYIITGSQEGVVHVYDILSGDCISRLAGHQATVRDVSWHPTLPILITASWDCTVARWEYTHRTE